MRNKLLCIVLALNHTTFAQDIVMDPEYSDYDKHKAVISCMQYLYVQHHVYEPAEENLFPLCEQRFLVLSRTLSHKAFVQARSGQDEKLMQVYYDTLFGLPSRDLHQEDALPLKTPNLP